jgi:acetoacetyl-CoA synthetase
VQFYEQLWESQNFIHEGSYTQVVDESIPISKLPRWFEGVRLNWAENMLWNRSAADAPGTRTTVNKEDDKVAAIEVREGNSARSKITWGQLRARVGELAAVLKARGVKQGDRVVMVGSHSIQTLVVFLATTWLGGIFSSSSTDMGVGGLLQRTLQVDPKVSRSDQLLCRLPNPSTWTDRVKHIVRLLRRRGAI